ncbi:MAG: hypothetical protein JJE30_06635 [Desulfuromonadales bacterium]|nr:hypothetical protein [Desulfuromonadales bacterium]
MKRWQVLTATVATVAMLLHARDAVSEMPKMQENQLKPIELIPSAPVTVAILTMKNNSPFAVELLVDGQLACTASPHDFCKTSIAAGTHDLAARSGGKTVISRKSAVNFEQGANRNWTVNYKE